VTQGRVVLVLLTTESRHQCYRIFISGLRWYFLNVCGAASVALNWNAQCCSREELSVEAVMTYAVRTTASQHAFRLELHLVTVKLFKQRISQ
jgi:hypothetical protein